MNETPPDPAPIRELAWAHIRSSTLAAAVELQIFSALGRAPGQGVAGLGRELGCSERGLRALLDALVAMELLEKDGESPGERYRNAPLAASYLDENSADYLGDWLADPRPAEDWRRLAECVRSGRPLGTVHERESAEDFFPRLIPMLHAVFREPARRGAAELLRRLPPSAEPYVLDLACGSGVWGIAVAEAETRARIAALDFPGILERTRAYAERHGVADRFSWLPGDLHEVALGEARFAAAILGNIVHAVGTASSRELFRRLYRALIPGGVVAVVDQIPDDDRRGPVQPLLFALNMLLHTQEGGTYTRAEYRSWFEEAGFARVETADIGMQSPLLLAIKDGSRGPIRPRE